MKAKATHPPPQALASGLEVTQGPVGASANSGRAQAMQIGGSSPKANGMRLVALATGWESRR